MNATEPTAAEHYLKLAQDAWQAQNFALAHEHITKAITLNPQHLSILELASWIELQFNVPRATVLADQYLTLKNNQSLPTAESTNDARLLKTIFSRHGTSKPVISIILPSRKSGQNDNQLPELISCLNNNTLDKAKLEIIIRINDHDDLRFFKSTIELLDADISYQIISGSNGKGFRDTHVFLAQAYSFCAASSKIIIPCNDKTIFFARHWDQLLLNKMHQGRQAPYLVNVTSQYQLRLNEASQLGLLAYFTRPIPNLYAINRQFLDVLTNQLDSQQASPFGTSYNIDVYLSLVSYLLNKSHTSPSGSDNLHLVMRHRDAPEHLVSHADRQLWSMLAYHAAIKDQMLDKLETAVQTSLEIMKNKLIPAEPQSKKPIVSSHLTKIKRVGRLIKARNKMAKVKSIIKDKLFERPALRNLFLSLRTKPSDFYFRHCDNMIREGNISAALDFYKIGNETWLGESKLQPKRVTKQKVAATTEVVYRYHAFSQRQNSGPKISLVLGSRMRGNENSNLTTFIDSIIKTTSDPANIEILISVDSDDDIKKLVNILKPITRVTIKAFSNARGRGYYDLNIKYEALLNHLAPSSKILIVCSDDSHFAQPKWDTQMLKKLAEIPDEIAFFNIFLEREIYLGDYNLFTWWLFQRGPSTLFPSVSRKLLDICHHHFEQDSEWSAFGHSIMMDSFFEMLRWHVWNQSGENRFINIPDQIVRQIDNTNIVANTKKLQIRFRDGLMLYSAALSHDYQHKLEELAVKITKAMIKTNTHQTDAVSV